MLRNNIIRKKNPLSLIHKLASARKVNFIKNTIIEKKESDELKSNDIEKNDGKINSIQAEAISIDDGGVEVKITEIPSSIENTSKKTKKPSKKNQEK